jgi:hypothetical protein
MLADGVEETLAADSVEQILAAEQLLVADGVDQELQC